MAKNTGPSFDDLATAFRHQNFDPLYFFFGEEGFLIDKLQELLVEHALPPEQHDFNLDRVYGSDATPAEVLALCQGYPVMAERRVVIVREFEKLGQGLGDDAKAHFKSQFKAYAQSPNPHAVVLLACASKPNLAAHPYRALKKHATWSQFKPLYDNQMPGWIQKYAQQQGYAIGPEAVQMLSDYVGTDLQAAASELEKLATFVGGRDRLTADDVLAASGQTREINVFELQKSIGAGRPRDAYRIVEGLLQQATNPTGEGIKIVAILNGYFDKLWALQAPKAQSMNKYKIASHIGVPPFFAEEYRRAARRYSKRSIGTAFRALLAADFELKGGSTREPLLILTLLLRRVLPPRARASA
jgi:DNA polymerase-3 subunit delta